MCNACVVFSATFCNLYQCDWLKIKIKMDHKIKKIFLNQVAFDWEIWFRFWNPDLGFYNRTRNPKTDFTSKKSVLNVDSNLKHSNLDFVDFFIYRLNGKYENGFAKRFPANYACTFKTTVLANSLKNAFSNFPPKKQKERISKKRFLIVEIRFRIWRSISNLKSGIQNPNPADFPIERNLSKLQFRKLLSSKVEIYASIRE